MVLGSGTSASGHRPAGSLASSRLGTQLSRSGFGLQGRQLLPIHVEVILLIFVSGVIMGMSSAQETWLQHQTSCRHAEPNAIQKLNNKLELYPVENGLSKRKQL